MCEIFGISTAKEYPANAFIRSFIEDSEEHHSGWGLALIEDGHAAIEKEPVQATKSRYLNERLRCLNRAGDMLAHIRLATVGYSVYENCHPFTGRDASKRQWTLIHNGTLFGAPYLSDYHPQQLGTTDSEQFLLYLLDQMNAAIADKQQPLSFEERFRVLDAAVCRVSEGSKLNLLIHDGAYLYVHRNFADSLYCLEDEDTAVFCTRELTLKSGWNPVPENRLQAWQNGRLQAEGTNHGHTFTYSDDQLQYLYSAFATL